MDEKFPNVCPYMAAMVGPDELSKAPFPSDAPVGAVIHYTADRGMDNIRKSLVNEGLCYHLIISREGRIEQHAWLNKQVWHAGRATWRGWSPNHAFLAIALESWGELVQRAGLFKSWNNIEVDPLDVQERPDNISGKSYFWDAATPEQLVALQRICCWLVKNGMDVENICGHDECAIPRGRKIDPGGVLPMTMAQYRQFIRVDTEKTS